MNLLSWFILITINTIFAVQYCQKHENQYSVERVLGGDRVSKINLFAERERGSIPGQLLPECLGVPLSTLNSNVNSQLKTKTNFSFPTSATWAALLCIIQEEVNKLLGFINESLK